MIANGYYHADMRRSLVRGLFLVGALLFGYLSIDYSRSLLDPRQNLKRLLAIKKELTVNEYQIGASAFNRLANGYCIVLRVTQAEFEPVTHIVITEIGSHLHVELITGPGEENIKILRDKAAREWLTKHNLDLQ